MNFYIIPNIRKSIHRQIQPSENEKFENSFVYRFDWGAGGGGDICMARDHLTT
jgi:hypothetical protein